MRLGTLLNPMYAIGDFTMLKNYLPYNNAEVKDKLQPQKKTDSS